ncbi:ABC transporter permease [Zavarzinia sp. CC-PAN008]|uniref:ABC transporter permease n=1 Tax=Zavarzinia sp. CC-PAN008 TaxID=3243332 RepID=UPI003F743BD8
MNVRRRRRDWGRIALLAWVGLVLAFLFLPIAVVVLYSFNGGRNLYVWTEFSTAWYPAALDNPRVLGALAVSFQAALISAVISVGFGAPAGLALARARGAWSPAFMVLAFVIIGTPELVSAIAQMIWLDRLGIFDGLARLSIGHSLFNIAVVALIVRARAEGLDAALERAAADLGATPFRAFRQVTLPLIFPAVLAGALLSFSFSFDDVIISLFVQRPGSSTLPLYILSSVKPGLKGDVAAAVVMTLGISLAAIVAAAAIMLRGGRKGRALGDLAG